MNASFPTLTPGKYIRQPHQLRVEGLNNRPWFLPVASNPFESGRDEFGWAWMLDDDIIETDAMCGGESSIPSLFYEVPWTVSYEQFSEIFREGVSVDLKTMTSSIHSRNSLTGGRSSTISPFSSYTTSTTAPAVTSTTSSANYQDHSRWSALHQTIAYILNKHCQSTGALVWNVTPYVLNNPSFDRFALPASTLYAHAGLLIALNKRLLRLLPYTSLPTYAPCLQAQRTLLQPYLLSTTKSLVSALQVQQRRTPVTLQADSARLPVEIRSYRFNRLAARRERLLTLPEESIPAGLTPAIPSRLQASMIGLVTSLLCKIHARTLRIGYIHPSHGGQRRAFHVDFLGEGGIDNGGLYRELFRSVMQELHDLELFPYLQHTPNRTQDDADLGKDYFLFNTAVLRQPQWEGEKTLRGLGRFVGTAIMSGLQVDLFLSVCMWKMVVGEEMSMEDLKRMDLARWKWYKSMLTCDVGMQ